MKRWTIKVCVECDEHIDHCTCDPKLRWDTPTGEPPVYEVVVEQVRKVRP